MAKKKRISKKASTKKRAKKSLPANEKFFLQYLLSQEKKERPKFKNAISIKKKGEKIDLNFTGSSEKNKELSLDNFDWQKNLKSLIQKNRVKGIGVKPPKGVIVIITFYYKGNEYVQARTSPVDFVVTSNNIRLFIQSFIDELLNADLGEDYDAILKKARIKQITIKFIY